MDASVVKASPKLIIIRGPAGSGKSTTAARVVSMLRSIEGVSPVAIIEQDYFNNTIGGRQKCYRELAMKMILQNGLVCYEQGYHLILEGVLNTIHYNDIFTQLINVYGVNNTTFYYYNVSLEETKRRHLTRAKATEFSETLLDEWYSCAQPTGYTNEIILSEELSIDASTHIIVTNFMK